MWYAVSVMIKGTCPTRDADDMLWEECIILIDAESADHAREKAESVSSAKETEYVSATGDRISWRFERVAFVYEIGEELGDATELFARFLRNSEAESLSTRFGEAPGDHAME